MKAKITRDIWLVWFRGCMLSCHTSERSANEDFNNRVRDGHGLPVFMAVGQVREVRRHMPPKPPTEES